MIQHENPQMFIYATKRIRTRKKNVHGGVGEEGMQKNIVSEEGEVTKDCRKHRSMCS